MIEVFGDHQVVGTHPADAHVDLVAITDPVTGALLGQDLQITNPGQTVATVYPHGTWSAYGEAIPVCAFLKPRPSCPRCFLPAPPVVPGPGPLPAPLPPGPRLR